MCNSLICEGESGPGLPSKTSKTQGHLSYPTCFDWILFVCLASRSPSEGCQPYCPRLVLKIERPLFGFCPQINKCQVCYRGFFAIENVTCVVGSCIAEGAPALDLLLDLPVVVFRLKPDPESGLFNTFSSAQGRFQGFQGA